MDPVIRRFSSHTAADRADIEDDRLLTPRQHLARLFELRRMHHISPENPNGDEPRLARVYRIIEFPQR